MARGVGRAYQRATKLPAKLVAAIARQETVGQAAWEAARRDADYAAFEPHLAAMLGLRREEADAVGSASGDRYDALLDDYEPHATAAEVAAVFDELRGPLIKMLGVVRDADAGPDAALLTRPYPAGAQREAARWVAAAVGFDFDAGRIDQSAHPFCTGPAHGDTRITTRYDEHLFGDGFFGTLHEAGHAMYEQGLPKADHPGLPLAEAVSLGIHESQSRLWENLVGRSAGFWRWAYPEVRRRFPEALNGVEEARLPGAPSTRWGRA